MTERVTGDRDGIGEEMDDGQAPAVGVVVGMSRAGVAGAAASVGDGERQGTAHPAKSAAEVRACSVSDHVGDQLGDDQGGIVRAGMSGKDVAGPSPCSASLFAEALGMSDQSGTLLVNS